MSFLATIGHALLLSQDPDAISLCTRTFRAVAMDLETTSDLSTFLAKLSRQKYEAILVDFLLGDSASHALEEARKLPSSRNAVSFALTVGAVDGKQAFLAGAHFILERPLSERSLERTLKPAYGMILRERRRYFRCPITSIVQVLGPEGGWNCTAVNISEGGMCASFPEPLKGGHEVSIVAAVEELNITAECEVCWSLEDGLTGLKFIHMPLEMKANLQSWLGQKLEAMCPPEVIANVGGPTAE